MVGVQQHHAFHAEGDVYVHTKMVAQELINSDGWNSMSEQDRHVLFVAALLHDVGKVVTTQMVDGIWRSPKHSVIGEADSRDLIWKGEVGGSTPFAVREEVAKLVRYHGLPLMYLEKQDPSRSVIEASLHVNLYKLSVLAEADVLGRTTEPDSVRQEMLDQLRYFREYAQELGCLHAPYPFESEHHRFKFCVEKKDIEYIPYDDFDKGTVIVMCGLPASGKSTTVDSVACGSHIISLDEIRKELKVSPGDRGAQSGIARHGRELAKEYLRKGEPFVWDATSTRRDQRAQVIALASTYGFKARVIHVDADRSVLVDRNRKRKNPVPDYVIENMMRRFQPPGLDECHYLDTLVS
jgi:predicted kinase